MKEIWKDIKGYEGLYQVSNLGRVKSLNFNHSNKEKIMNLTKTKKGYYKVNLKTSGKTKTSLVHRLVAEAFIPNLENKPLVLHKQAISNNGTNEVTNLYWGTQSNNMKDRTRDGNFKNPRKGKFGKDNPTCKKVYQYDKNKKLIKLWDSITEASNNLNINHSQIVNCCKKRLYRQTAGGYVWEYKE